MKKQVLKSFNGVIVTYDSNRKCNKFVITKHGKVVEKYADFLSSVKYVYDSVGGNFESMNIRERK